MSTGEMCVVCGLPLEIGQQGCIVTIRPHEPVLEYHPFIPYFDFALGREVTSLAERKRYMKPEMDGDHEVRGRLEYRDKMSKGALSARLDRVNEQKREEAHR